MLFFNLEKHVDAQILSVIDEICMFMYHVNEGVIVAWCYDMLLIKKNGKLHV